MFPIEWHIDCDQETHLLITIVGKLVNIAGFKSVPVASTEGLTSKHRMESSSGHTLIFCF